MSPSGRSPRTKAAKPAVALTGRSKPGSRKIPAAFRPEHLYAVILAGGSGTRFWPLSRELFPKQLLKVLSDRTLLQRTVERVTPMIPADHVFVVTGAAHAEAVRFQVGPLSVPKANILVEPVGRNTAPAIGWAAATLRRLDPDATMVVLPADHVIPDGQKFLRALEVAARVAQDGSLVTFGIVPLRPDTGYGYIQAQPKRRIGKGRQGGVMKVRRFVEKPDLATAKRYVRAGDFYWNSGIFVWRAETILQEMETTVPALSAGINELAAQMGTDAEALTLEQFYRKAEAVSIDYGVMQKTTRAAVIPATFRWSDIGNWASLDEVAEKDAAGNVRIGAILDMGSRGSVLYGEHRLVATIGLTNMVVVDTADATLVCPKDRAQDVKQLVESLRKSKAPEQLVHRTVMRPWGHYTVLEEGPRYKVKRLTVNPGGRLSLQLHNKRSEHWVVTMGIARVTCDERVFELHANESTIIPQGAAHRLENPGEAPLHLIETQCGDYVGEDDIVRLADDYDRAGTRPLG